MKCETRHDNRESIFCNWLLRSPLWLELRSISSTTFTIVSSIVSSSVSNFYKVICLSLFLCAVPLFSIQFVSQVSFATFQVSVGLFPVYVNRPFLPVSPSFVAIRFVAGCLRSRRTCRERTTEMFVQLRANVVRTTSNLKKKFEHNRIFCNLMHRTATWNIRPMSRKSAHRRTRVLQKSRSLVSIAFHRIECDPIDRKLR